MAGDKAAWSALQDVLLMQAVDRHADKWQVISTAVPGKSPLECSARTKELQEQGIQSLKELQAKQKAQNAHKPPLPKRKFIQKKPSLFDNVPPLSPEKPKRSRPALPKKFRNPKKLPDPLPSTTLKVISLDLEKSLFFIYHGHACLGHRVFVKKFTLKMVNSNGV
jgi:hypothetical protein